MRKAETHTQQMQNTDAVTSGKCDSTGTSQSCVDKMSANAGFWGYAEVESRVVLQGEAHLVNVGARHKLGGEQPGRAQLGDDLGHVDIDVEPFIRCHELPELLLAARLV